MPDKTSHLAILLLMLIGAACIFAYGWRILDEAYPPPSPRYLGEFVIGDTLTNGMDEAETTTQ